MRRHRRWRSPWRPNLDAAPGVEAAVQELQLRRARLEGEEAEGGVEQSPTSILITAGALRHHRFGRVILGRRNSRSAMLPPIIRLSMVRISSMSRTKPRSIVRSRYVAV